MSSFSSMYDVASIARQTLKGRTPLIAAMFLCSALGTVALAKIPVALSSSPAATPAVVAAAPAELPNPTVDRAAPAVQTATLSCEQQTWPYIDRSCAGADASAAKKRLVRVISPERSRVAEPAPAPVVAVSSPQSPVAETFASLSLPAPIPTQQFTPAAQARRDAASYEAPVVRRTAEIKRPKPVAVRTASRVDRPAMRRVAAPEVVAQGENYQVRRVYVDSRDVAHGLY